MLLDEKDMGDAGKRIYDSVLMLALLCKWGPPESAEFASVTKELAPTLGPEFATLLKTALFMSPETGPKLGRPVPGIEFDELPNDELKWELTKPWDCPSPWKKIPELEEDWARAPATREGAIPDTDPWWPESK